MSYLTSCRQLLPGQRLYHDRTRQLLSNLQFGGPGWGPGDALLEQATARIVGVTAGDSLDRTELRVPHDEEPCVGFRDYGCVVHRPLPHLIPSPAVAGRQGVTPTVKRNCPQPALGHDQELAAELSLDGNLAALLHHDLIHVRQQWAQLRI